MLAQLRVLSAIALFATACSSTAPPPPSLTGPPSLVAAPSSTGGPSSRSSPLPSPIVSPAASPIHAAAFSITGEGNLYCADAFYGGCQAALLLQPFADGPLPRAVDFPAPMDFTIERPRPIADAEILGPVTGAPSELEVGRWRIGLARVISSDDGECDSPCTSPYFPTFTDHLCAAEFDVGPATERVEVLAHFGSDCHIDVSLAPALASPSALSSP
jgi:hypothetical protein